MGRYINFKTSDSGFDYTIKYSKNTIEKYFIPFIEELADEFVGKGSIIYTLGIAGPPGCGKSAISSIFQLLLKERGISSFILPLDGFHLRNEELHKRKITLQNSTYSLYEIKGAKETYDVNRLVEAMNKLKAREHFFWPVYLRTVHEPVDEGIYISNQNAVYIIEGNYLFLTVSPWSTLSEFFNKRVFIVPRRRFLKQKIIRRKCRGGYSKKEAMEHYRRSDLRNIREVLTRSDGYDYEIRQRGKYSYILKKSQRRIAD